MTCSRERELATLSANDERLFKTLDRMEHWQREVTEVLQKIATQQESIANLKKDQTKTEEDVATLFERVRELELQPGKRWEILWSALIAAIVSFFVGKA